MAKRLIDVMLGALALVVTAPLLAVAALGIRLASPGPVFYRGERVGRHRRPFRMYKFRTMHAENGKRASAITAKDDPRVFAFGGWLRRSKIDELPQLLNVLRGEMAIIGPRPEDPKFVDAHYTPAHLETLEVRPGLASPGSIYNYTHGEAMLTGSDPERRYIEQLLPVKLALDVVYVRGASLWYDVTIVARTVGAIMGTLLGRRRFADPPEMAEAQRLVAAPPASAPPAPVPALLERLGNALQTAGVAHCQWKGHVKRERWATGAGDLDLLVDAESMPTAATVLAELGFKRARGAAELELPGAATFLGCDGAVGRLLNVHVHDRLVVGDPWRTHYTLPLAPAFLASTRRTEPFPLPLPAPELEYLVFVIRTTLRHRLRDALPGRRWLAGIQGELAYLEGRAEMGRVMQQLGAHLPAVTPALFAACRDALRPEAPLGGRLQAARGLRRALRAWAVRPGLGARARLALWHHWTSPRASLAAGGRLVSLVGGDGAGKSTCVRELRAWLGADLPLMTAHLGRPPRSLLTLCVGAALKVRNLVVGPAPDPDTTPDRFPGYLGLLRLVCTARDRFRLYARARAFATAGGVALCERHPIPQNRPLAGPAVEGFIALAPRPRLASRLAALEQRYYDRIPAPDALFVLRVDPELAVRRKTDEPADYVRRRARIVWDTDWSGSGARIIDAGRPLPQVLSDLKGAIWTAL
jgi:lipopolysaccharide/colanic/teichoic acid biosynthesis glycosyltransferase